MGQAALFIPPTIHRTNMVLFPKYLQKSRVKQFCKSIQGNFMSNQEGLMTVVNDVLEFHYKIYNRHIELEEITYTPKSIPDALRCLEFLKYESYLLQKPIYWSQDDSRFSRFLEEQGFRLLTDEQERREIYEGFWEQETQKV